jgi:hypothetical protein
MTRRQQRRSGKGRTKRNARGRGLIQNLAAIAPDAPDSIGERIPRGPVNAPVGKITKFTPKCFGAPDRLMTTLRYHSIGSISSTSGAPGSYAFRWNSTFDPDITSTGHQPLYRDSFAAIYDHYSVVSARAMVRFQNDTSDPFLVGVVTDDNSSPSTTLDTLCEQAHGQQAMMSPLTGSRSSVKFFIGWSCKKVLGINPFASETYKTPVGSNPAEESDLILWAADAAGNTNSVIFDIELEYDVLWTELTTPSQS